MKTTILAILLVAALGVLIGFAVGYHPRFERAISLPSPSYGLPSPSGWTQTPFPGGKPPTPAPRPSVAPCPSWAPVPTTGPHGVPACTVPGGVPTDDGRGPCIADPVFPPYRCAPSPTPEP